MTLVSFRARALALSTAMLVLGGAIGCEGQSSNSPPPPPGGAPPPAAAADAKATKDKPISNAAQDSARPGGKAP